MLIIHNPPEKKAKRPKKAKRSFAQIMPVGTWVVCLDSQRRPTTWGTISECGRRSSYVKYGLDAPVWNSNLWEHTYLFAVLSEKTARQLVQEQRSEEFEENFP